MDAKRTPQFVVLEVKLFQMGKLAKLLGRGSCRVEMEGDHRRMKQSGEEAGSPEKALSLSRRILS